MQSRPSSRKLTTWKEIANFLGCGERTVKRWEAERGLPVHRLPGKSGSRIYADPDELSLWLTSAAAEAPTDVPEPLRAFEPPVPASGGASRPARKTWLLAGGATLSALIIAIIGHMVLSARRPVAPANPNPKAVELYQEGVHDWNTRTPAGLARAVDEFTQAIVRDPQYAQAYVGLANCYILLREFAAMPDAEAYPRAEAAAGRAIILDPRLARGHGAQAFVLAYWRWDLAGADREFRTALNLDPRDALVHHWYANVLKDQRKWPEALAQIEAAQKLDPDSSAILADKAWILVNRGDITEGRAILQRLEQLDPSFGSPHAYLAILAMATRDYPTFLNESRLLVAASGDVKLRQLTDAADRGWQGGGERGLLSSLLFAQVHLHAQGGASAYEIARTYSIIGDEAHCVQWMHVAIQDHEPSIMGFLVDPSLAKMRNAPAMQFVRDVVEGRAAERLIQPSVTSGASHEGE